MANAMVLKNLRLTGPLKICRAGGLFVAGALLGATLLAATPAQCADPVASPVAASQPGEVQTPSTAADAQPQSATKPEAAPVTHSPGLAEILKMADAKVSPEVMKAYIRNSPIPYQLSATDVIALKEHGVAADVIVALLARGGELRSQAMQKGVPSAPPQVPQPVAVSPPATAPVYEYAPETAYPAYSYAYPAPVYPGYNYWWYDYSYLSPYFCWPFFGFVYYGHPRSHFHGRPHLYYSSSGPWSLVYGRPGHSGVRGGFSHPRPSGGSRAPVFSERAFSFAGHAGASRPAGFAARPSGFAGRSFGRGR